MSNAGLLADEIIDDRRLSGADMLTTSGSTIKSDIEMIMRIGRKNYGIID